jgi:hypothetical protein
MAYWFYAVHKTQTTLLGLRLSQNKQKNKTQMPETKQKPEASGFWD